jgi:hypothetical protein
MSAAFTREAYLYAAGQLRDRRIAVETTVMDNFHVILNALDMAAINLTSSSTAEPEADGDRTVHPAMDRVPATELLRRVTALERLVNDTTAYLVNPSGSKISELARSRDRWLKSRAGEWVS